MTIQLCVLLRRANERLHLQGRIERIAICRGDSRDVSAGHPDDQHLGIEPGVKALCEVGVEELLRCVVIVCHEPDMMVVESLDAHVDGSVERLGELASIVERELPVALRQVRDRLPAIVPIDDQRNLDARLAGRGEQRLGDHGHARIPIRGLEHADEWTVLASLLIIRERKHGGAWNSSADSFRSMEVHNASRIPYSTISFRCVRGVDEAEPAAAKSLGGDACRCCRGSRVDAATRGSHFVSTSPGVPGAPRIAGSAPLRTLLSQEHAERRTWVVGTAGAALARLAGPPRIALGGWE